METKLFGWARASMGLLGPSKSLYVAKEVARLCNKTFGWERLFGLVPSMETRLLGWESSWSQVEPVCGLWLCYKFPVWEQSFLGGNRASWSQEKPSALLWLAPLIWKQGEENGKGLRVGLRGPRKSPVAKEVAVPLAPYMETKFLAWERPFMGLLGSRESPCVTYGSAISSPYGNKAFWNGQGLPLELLSPRKSLYVAKEVVLILAPYMERNLDGKGLYWGFSAPGRARR